MAGPKGFLLENYIFPITNQIQFPRLKRWIVERMPSSFVQDVKDIVDVMHETAIDICKTKQRAIEEGHGDDGKKDIISILSRCCSAYHNGSCREQLLTRYLTIVRANASAAEEDRLSDEEVIGQVSYVLPS
jgi:hypothetical protein